MLKRSYLCILWLLLLGMLCMPVAAETGDTGYWSFSIINHIRAISDADVNLNGHGDTGKYQKVYVSDSLDQVVVEFAVPLGPATNLTITKDSITRLRNEHPDWEPALLAWGGSCTYDVDAGWWWWTRITGHRYDYESDRFFLDKHLMKRGAVHVAESFNEESYQFVFFPRDLHTRYVL